ncbi:MAG: substrate-binding domain-containing protein [Proteobacteria bacterium]|nr:phosphate ABC transporter substrate-binding protein [Desulfobulbaceae bacterium]MBU4151746.1 substrate-binding domain-containing protein [Pseudomonadota bacterium]
MNRIFTLLLLVCFWTNPVLAQETLMVAGTGENQEVVRALAKKFEELHSGVTVEVPDSIGSGGGIKALLKGKTDLARTGRPLKDSEKSGLVEVKFGQTPVVFATHPTVTTVDNLTTAQILDIFSGKINNWKEVGGPDNKIYPTSREVGDSARIVLEALMPGFKDLQFVSKEFFTSAEAVQALADHEFTIGYVSMASSRGKKVTVLKVDGKSPVVGVDGRVDYPYLVPFYLVHNEKPSVLATQFIDFVLSSEGRAILLANGAVPVN